MKILTRKKREKILELLIKSGVAISEDAEVPYNAYKKVNNANYEIADLVGGTGMIQRYYDITDRVFQDMLAKMGGK